MLKSLFKCFLLFCLVSFTPKTFAQIHIVENFNSLTGLPTGWAADTGSIPSFGLTSTPQACDGKALSDQVSSFFLNQTSTIETVSQTSNGGAVSISFDFKAANNSHGALTTNWGNFYLDYQIGSGAWTTALTINNSNYSNSPNCSTFIGTIAAGTIPNGQTVKFRFRDQYGVSGTPDYYVVVDNVSITQTASTPPNCDAILTSPLNGAPNVPVSTTQIFWSDATGGATNYRISIGTTPGGTNIANNVNVGDVNSYTIPAPLLYATTYYVRIVPTNSSGSATGCTDQSFTTELPITTTTPWEEPFQNFGGPPHKDGWVIPDGFTVPFMPLKFASNPNNLNRYIIYSQVSASTSNFQTISVGQVESGDLFEVDYAFASYYDIGYLPDATYGNVKIYVSTNHGISYSPTPIATLTPNSTNTWRTFSYDLSSYIGQFVKFKIEVNRTTNFSVGLDNFYVGHEITCEKPLNLELDFVGATSARASWDAVSGAVGYNWKVFYRGANPDIDSPVLQGNTSSTQANINGLNSGTEYDFYVQSNCDTQGLSLLSDVLEFQTHCAAVTDFPFVETFEVNSPTWACWRNEYVVSGSLKLDWKVILETSPNSIAYAHEGDRYALFARGNNDGNITKFVSVPLDLTGSNTPKLSFWYLNAYQEDPEYPGQNTLKVFYKTSPGSNWVQIGTNLNTDVTEWTKVELDLPNPSSEYYIAFEAKNNFGIGTAIDTITVENDFTCSDETIWNGISWSNGVPNDTKKAIIDGTWILNADFVACQIEVTENGYLEIPSNYTLTVLDKITNLATANDFIVRNDANLIQERDLVNEGEITVYRTGQPFKRLDYSIWSSPVLGQELKAFSPQTLVNRIMTYNGADGYITVPDPYVDFVPGQGVLFRAPNNWSSTVPTPYNGVFRGIPQNGNYTHPTYAGNYTSVGNPYPSNLDGYKFLQANPDVATLYFWTNVNPVENGSYSGHNYATFSLAGGVAAENGTSQPNGSIIVGQGFVVKSAGNSVSFTNSMRTDEPTVFFKNEQETEKHRIWLNFSDQNDYGLNQILIAYMDGATNGIDHQIDAKMMSYNGSSLYNYILEQPFIIQGKPLPFEPTERIILGLKIANSGRFKIKLANVEGIFESDNQEIFLKDLKTQTIHSLRDSDYEFEEVEGNYWKRFELLFIPERDELENAEFASNEIIIYKNKDKIEILSNYEQIESVEVWDLSGRKLWMDNQLNSKFHFLYSKYFGKQVIIIGVRMKNGKTYSQKIIN